MITDRKASRDQNANSLGLKRRTAILEELLLFLIVAVWTLVCPVQAQYLGVTCGYDYSNDLKGPNTGMHNTPLFNSLSSNPNLTWDDWAEELGAAGVDFVCPNLRGSYPNTSCNPTNMAPLMTALKKRGMANRIKFAIFDDNATSWTAQWNGNFSYDHPFDIAVTNNWAYLWDYNYKLFYQTIPDTNRFKINGRPVIIIWTGNTYFITNMQGNVSKALKYVRQQCQSTFGFNPFIILSGDFLSHDTTCNDTNVTDAIENWFTPNSKHTNGSTLATFNGVKIGALCPQFQNPNSVPDSWLDPMHGVSFAYDLGRTRGAGALLTLVEGFTDWEEDAACFRVRNLDPSGNALTYVDTYYDYPSQRLNILRRYGNSPMPVSQKLEAEMCDYFGGGSPRPGYPNYYRNGNINIELTSDVSGGWNVSGINPGQWLEWEEVPIQGGAIHLRARVASPSGGGKMHFVIDGVVYPTMSIPASGGWQTWTTLDAGVAYQFAKDTTHTVRLVCETGGFNLNYLEIRDEIPIGYTISLKSKANNLWVTAPNSGLSPLIASSSTVGPSESFMVVDASHYGYGYVGIMSLANNKYVTAHANSSLPLIASASSIGESQLFQWIDNGDGTVAMRAVANQMVVCAENMGSQPLIANRLNAGSWETFTYTTTALPSVAEAPTGLTAIPGDGQVILTWNEALGATSYNVKRSLSSGGPYTLIASSVASCAFTDSNLVNGITCYYVVTAINAGGESSNSTQVRVTPIAPDFYAQTVLTKGPAGYWRLNENSGTNALDSSTNGRNGRYGFGVGLGAFGPNPPFIGLDTNSAALFQGLSTSYVALPALNLNSARMTFAAWIFPTVATQTKNSGLIFWRDSGGHSSGFCFSDNGKSLSYNWNDDSTLWHYDSGLTPPLNQWSFVVCAVTSSNATLYVYNTNGQSIVTNTHSHASAAFSGEVRIGSDSLNDGVRNFNGRICHAAVFNASLSLGQINQLYSAGSIGAPVSPDPMSANLVINKYGLNVTLTWSAGTLIESTNVAGPWTTNFIATSPYTVSSGIQKFYRVRLQ